MNTEENNKMIAEFMGVGELYEAQSSNQWNQYHESWDWLMPVVEKIESLGYSYDRINADVFINTQEGKNIIPNPMDGNTMTMLQKTYRVVVEFINQLNK